MDLSNDIFFTTVATILIPLVVAILLALAEKTKFVWATVNQPSIAAFVGGILGALYHSEVVYAALNNAAPEGTLATGFAGSGIKSWAKDLRSGAITATTVADVKAMRGTAPNAEEEIGS